MSNTKEQATSIVYQKIEYTDCQLNKWKEEFMADPLYAFKWSEAAIEMAAMISVLRYTLRMLGDDKQTIETITSRLTGEVVRGARSVRNNGMHGKCDDYEIAAKVRVLETVFCIEL